MPKDHNKKGKGRRGPHSKQQHTSHVLTMRSSIAPVATRLRTKLKYSTVYYFNTTLAFDQQYRLNSLFDPDETGTGSQPNGFDQLAALYSRYRVWNTSYSVSALGNTAVNTMLVFAVTNTNTSLASNLQQAMNFPFSHTVQFNVYQGAHFRKKIDLALLNGRTHQQYIDDDVTGALVTGNPSEVLNLHMIMNSSDGGSNGNGNIMITFEYDVEFYDPTQLTPSFYNNTVAPSVVHVNKEQVGSVSAPSSLLGMIGL